MRRAITGGPRTGKTTLAGPAALHTDDLLAGRDWSAQSAEVAHRLDAPGDLTLEGCTVARGLRKWLAAHPTGKPIDELTILTQSHCPLTQAQVTMAKGITTVLDEITPELERRGVRIIRR